MERPDVAVDIRQKYAPPVDQLLCLGDPKGDNGSDHDWRDYAALGIAAIHIPELIRLLLDFDNYDDPETDAAWWGQLHAWRALAQLRATEAFDALLEVADYREADLDDWTPTEYPRVFGEIGPAIVSRLGDELRSSRHEVYCRVSIAGGLREMGAIYPDSRGAVIDHLTRALELHLGNPPELNGFIITDLIKLRAVESAEPIERAFAAGVVDEGTCGSWDDVRTDLGIPGMGLVTKQSPRNPNSFLEFRERVIEQARRMVSKNYGAIVAEQRRDRRKNKRRRRR